LLVMMPAVGLARALLALLQATEVDSVEQEVVLPLRPRLSSLVLLLLVWLVGCCVWVAVRAAVLQLLGLAAAHEVEVLLLLGEAAELFAAMSQSSCCWLCCSQGQARALQSCCQSWESCLAAAAAPVALAAAVVAAAA
jgi:hypothetical protein